jgi:hypothetical protein
MQVQTLSLSGEIDAWMTKSGVRNSGWYVGITADIQGRLFDYHQVSRRNDTWIYRCCPNAAEARSLESAYHRAGCKGAGGGGDGACVYIYAYVITLNTVE